MGEGSVAREEPRCPLSSAWASLQLLNLANPHTGEEILRQAFGFSVVTSGRKEPVHNEVCGRQMQNPVGVFMPPVQLTAQAQPRMQHVQAFHVDLFPPSRPYAIQKYRTRPDPFLQLGSAKQVSG